LTDDFPGLLNQGNEKIQRATTELNRFATLLEESLRSREAKRTNRNGATHCRTIAIVHGIYSPEGVCPGAAIACARVHVNILDRFRALVHGSKGAALLEQIHCTVNIDCFRHLSPAIGTKQNVLTVNLTVQLNLRGGNSRLFKRLPAPATIEWESSPNLET
jgi:hypothetical protein